DRLHERRVNSRCRLQPHPDPTSDDYRLDVETENRRGERADRVRAADGDLAAARSWRRQTGHPSHLSTRQGRRSAPSHGVERACRQDRSRSIIAAAPTEHRATVYDWRETVSTPPVDALIGQTIG